MGDMAWVGKKPLRRLGGMADALTIASDLGFSVPQEDGQNFGNVPGTGDKSDDLIRVLRELTTAQRNLANLQVELQGRQDDNSVAHLTHVSEMEKKCRILAKTTGILKDVIQNKEALHVILELVKGIYLPFLSLGTWSIVHATRDLVEDRIIARLQQPYSLDCIPVETEFQRQFSELLHKAASDYGALTASIADFQWSQGFKDPPSVWGEMLRPIPVALASCTRYFEAVSAIRESIAALHKLRVGSPSPLTPSKDSPWISDRGNSECATPPPWNSNYVLEEPNSDDIVIRSRKRLDQLESSAGEPDWVGSAEAGQSDPDGMKQRRLSWPPSPNVAHNMQ